MRALAQSVFAVVVAYLGATVFSGVACSAQGKAAAEDSAAIAACLDKAHKAKTSTTECIGTVQKPCMDMPEASSTVGMETCSGRETAVWDERLNTAYQALLGGDLGKVEATQDGNRKIPGAEILRDAQRAWIAFRDKKCAAAGLPMEGGTGARILAGNCYLEETGRQALWLEDMRAAE